MLIRFVPIYMERVWGGRRLTEVYGRTLPSSKPIGESWEMVDRPEAQSVVMDGSLHGKTLHELWASPERKKIFGTAAPDAERFPILIKMLDATDKLSLQVHPPAAIAPSMKGEPKTEMWFITATQPGADLFVGLKKGVSRAAFAEAVDKGVVADCFHRIETKPGDCMFLPSGRVHAIGAGNLIAEIQQNSDTTYRVYDWDRVGLDGKPRELHLDASMRSIDFNDCEPSLQQPDADPLVSCEFFTTRRKKIESAEMLQPSPESFTLFFVHGGTLSIGGETVNRGEWVFLSADSGDTSVEPVNGTCDMLTVRW